MAVETGDMIEISFIADIERIEVEPSDTKKYLRLRNGDYACMQKVFITTDGTRREITVEPDVVRISNTPP